MISLTNSLLIFFNCLKYHLVSFITFKGKQINNKCGVSPHNSRYKISHKVGRCNYFMILRGNL